MFLIAIIISSTILMRCLLSSSTDILPLTNDCRLYVSRKYLETFVLPPFITISMHISTSSNRLSFFHQQSSAFLSFSDKFFLSLSFFLFSRDCELENLASFAMNSRTVTIRTLISLQVVLGGNFFAYRSLTEL